MPITINKNSSATVLTIRNFSNVIVRTQTPYDCISDIVQTDADAILIKTEGAKTSITFNYTLMDEASTVVSGTGSPVTTAIDQFQYINSTLLSSGSTSFTDTYTLTLDYGGGETFAKTGVITDFTCQQTGDQPITFQGTFTFQVGTVT